MSCSFLSASILHEIWKSPASTSRRFVATFQFKFSFWSKRVSERRREGWYIYFFFNILTTRLSVKTLHHQHFTQPRSQGLSLGKRLHFALVSSEWKKWKWPVKVEGWFKDLFYTSPISSSTEYCHAPANGEGRSGGISSENVSVHGGRKAIFLLGGGEE